MEKVDLYRTKICHVIKLSFYDDNCKKSGCGVETEHYGNENTMYTRFIVVGLLNRKYDGKPTTTSPAPP